MPQKLRPDMAHHRPVGQKFSGEVPGKNRIQKFHVYGRGNECFAAWREDVKSIPDQERQNRDLRAHRHAEGPAVKSSQRSVPGATAFGKNHQRGAFLQASQAKFLNIIRRQAFSVDIASAAHGRRKEEQQPVRPAFRNQADIRLALRAYKIDIDKRLMVRKNNGTGIPLGQTGIMHAHRQPGPQEKKSDIAVKPDISASYVAHGLGPKPVQGGNKQVTGQNDAGPADENRGYCNAGYDMLSVLP